jgi:hypothetical protein
VSHLVIGEVSQLLRHTLWLGLKGDPVTSQQVTDEQNIVLSNPAQPIAIAAIVRQVSLWLYQVVPNDHLRNAPNVRRRADTDDAAVFYPPLGVNLLYLLTPSTGDDLGDQQVLGRALQTFHDQAILRLASRQDPDRAEELHLSLAPRTIEELAEVWEAMQQPYRLSVCYEVRAARIDSLRRLPAGRVSERETRLTPQAAVEV